MEESIFSRINRFLVGSNISFNPLETQITPEPQILKGYSPEEIYKKNLEFQQGEYFKSKYYSSKANALQRNMQYESQRLPAFLDYEGMEFYPIIASALDLFMEEATSIGDDGKMLRIYSDNKRVKALLEELFYNKLNVNINLPSWIRNMCKYGDNFVNLLIHPTKGVVAARQLINYNVERKEIFDKEKRNLSIFFTERDSSEKFQYLEMLHFRLIGDDKYLPYGTSVLNKVRRVWRQLVLAEDSVLSYRILRAGDRRVFKVFVGNMDDDDIDPYVDRVADRLKRSPQVNRENGNMDHRFNMIAVDEDLVVPVKDMASSNMVETLPGASDIDKIQDIQFQRDNLYTGLGIPKPFLSFQDAQGQGKLMSFYDIRLAKKVIRIQQAAIQELNKLAILHLLLLGIPSDQIKFNLQLTNPSLAQEQSRIELLQSKLQAYTDATRREDNGIAAMSHTNAKKLILNWSEDQIIDDLHQQKMESIVKTELQDSNVQIQKSGIFKDLETKFGMKSGIDRSNLEGGDQTNGANTTGNEQNAGDQGQPQPAPNDQSSEPPKTENWFVTPKYESLLNELHNPDFIKKIKAYENNE